MAKIKFSKTELKRQRDGLKRFTRFLPTLQLKKQQLQMEVQATRDEIRKNREALDAFRERVDQWVMLMASPEFGQVPELLAVKRLNTEIRNIAGVDVPVFESIEYVEPQYDLFETPPWLDSALGALKELLGHEMSDRVLRRREEMLEAELRTTTQRVNLFEKVKIPEAREAIRRIRIQLGDEMAAAVGRAKIAKGKLTTEDAA